jgi:phage I-like protein
MHKTTTEGRILAQARGGAPPAGDTVPLQGIAPSAGPGVPEWVMVARAGVWRGHPTAGTELITPAHLASALGYFQRHYAAHGADLVVDYHHASMVAPVTGSLAPAAGWIREMELRNEGAELWGRVLWTAEAANAIGRRQFRYLSPVLWFNVPDRVTGEPVPMWVHSVALTNTPFLTELESLNENRSLGGTPARPLGATATHPAAKGGEQMSLLETLAAALDRQPEQVASELGLAGAAEDKEVATAVLNAAARVNALEHEVQRAEARVVSAEVANALGVAADADETAVRAALIRLHAPSAGLAAVRAQLGLAADAPEAEVINAIGALQETRGRTDAEDLVNQAVADGRVPPAHRAFYLRAAMDDVAAAAQAINSLPLLTAPPRPRGSVAGRRMLDDDELSVCRQLGLSAEAFLSSAEK